MDAEPLLVVRDIHKHFAGVTALDGVTVEVRAGLIYGLIGPNGSGKTTLFNIITGFTNADSGTVSFDAQSLDRLPPHQIARRGLIRTFQASLCPQRMTVMENMLLASRHQSGESIVKVLTRPGEVRREERDHADRARALLGIVKLADKADDYAGSLSGGQKKLLMLAQVLMAEPRLVLLDEPVAGVNPKLIDDIAEIVRRLREDGQNFLIVEHNMNFVRNICDQVTVLDAGQVIAEGAAGDVLSRDDVLRAYLGRRGAGARPEKQW
jgi:neutral amino acid transport system ATP-binding protein